VTGLERIGRTFERCRAEGRAALVSYVMAGDPDLATSRRLALACAEGGADLLELGLPFSDPIADGPTIQRAGERALAAGTRTGDVLRLAASVRRVTEVPIALMGYLNTVLARGEERFAAEAARAGVDALILPDLPPEEAGAMAAAARARGLALVFLLAPTSTEARRRAACRAASGFLYLVSVTGVTGARARLPAELPALLAAVRAESPVPVVVGFGVSAPAQARRLGRLADGVVVGSAIVERGARPGPARARAERVRRFVASLSRALGPGRRRIGAGARARSVR